MTGEQDNISIREAEILKLVVSGFISTAQPVSSLYITENHDIGISSATVRSVFVDLENKGYLYSPHRSAGRIPTERAYRFYVENLPEERTVPDNEKKLIQREYLKQDFQLDQILNQTSRILSMLTNFAGVVIGPRREQTVLKHIELIDMGEEEVLVVLVTRSGMVYSKTIYLDTRIPNDYLKRISSYLNNVFKGLALHEMKAHLSRPETTGELQRYFPVIAQSIVANFDQVHGEEELYTSGVEKLYSQLNDEKGETPDVGRLFGSPGLMRGIFEKTDNLGDVMVVIEGDQNKNLEGLSIVTATYKMGEKKVGALGVVGPNRMDYFKVVSVVDFISRLLSNMITKISN